MTNSDLIFVCALIALIFAAGPWIRRTRSGQEPELPPSEATRSAPVRTATWLRRVTWMVVVSIPLLALAIDTSPGRQMLLIGLLYFAAGVMPVVVAFICGGQGGARSLMQQHAQASGMSATLLVFLWLFCVAAALWSAWQQGI